MDPVFNFTPPKVSLFLVFFLFTLFCVSADSGFQEFRGRRILDLAEKKKPTESLNKPLKSPNQSSKNQTKLIKSTSSTNKNKTTNSAPTLSLRNLNSTSKSTNSTKPISLNLKKPTNSTKPISSNLKKSTNSTKPISSKKPTDLPKLTKPKTQNTTKTNKDQKTEKTPKKQTQPKPRNWIDEDLVSEFRDLPTKFQETLIPDLARISSTSKAYITKANKQMTIGFKPIVGNKYASTIASLTSFAFILIPLILVTLIFNRIKAYFSLQKLLIFIQIYLSIYFGILCLSSLVTGLEPLKFFYSFSQSTYVCLQVMQTLGYIFYLLLLVMYLVLVFSTDCGLGSRLLGLAQTFVGFAVGLHYYVAVFHRVVLHQPPRTNWKIHGIYATCFLVICLLSGADRRKKSYLEEDGAEGKKS